jgi:hypothetical protein
LGGGNRPKIIEREKGCSSGKRLTQSSFFGHTTFIPEVRQAVKIKIIPKIDRK